MNLTIEEIKSLLGEKELIIFHLTKEVNKLTQENQDLKLKAADADQIVDFNERRGFDPK